MVNDALDIIIKEFDYTINKIETCENEILNNKIIKESYIFIAGVAKGALATYKKEE